MQKILCRVLVLSIAVLIAGHATEAAQQSAPARGTPAADAFTVCFVNNPNGEYLSAAFASSPQPSFQERQDWIAAFIKFVEHKYNVVFVGNTGCSQYRNRAGVDTVLNAANDPKNRIIRTDWIPGMAVVANAAAESSGTWAICYSDGGRSPVYYSGDIHLDFDVAKQAEKGAQDPRVVALTEQYQKQFLAFLQSKYGFTSSGAFPASCQFNMTRALEITALKARMTSQFPGAKFIETGWLPGSSPTLAASAPAPPPAAAAAPGTGIAGVYTGTYICGGRTRSLKLTITGPENGLVTAHFTAYYPPDARDKAYTFTSNGRLDPATGQFKLIPLKWDTAEPANVMMVGMIGSFDAKANKVTGKIDAPGCTTFEAMRGRYD